MRKLLTLSLLAAMFFALIPQTSSAAVVGFQAGRIIDNMVFTNNLSMNPDQIQTFLNSKMPTCDTWGTQKFNSTQTRAQYAATIGKYPPFTCLKDYSENGLTASQIIYNVAQQYRINPQVLIVLLQKEQSLVTDSWPYASQYQKATGYGCPDTAPCNTLYYGFTNQLTRASNMFRKILDNASDWYTPYILGNNYIRYNPDVACGGSTVNVQNRATQALYNYTPYQPNQGALDAGWGTAPCGTYGNRNFYSYFTSWFGPTQRNLVHVQGDGVYQVENGIKRAFPDEITFLSYGYEWSDVLSIGSAEFNLIPSGAAMPYNVHYRDGQLVTMDGNSIYLIVDGQKRNIPSESVFLSYSWKWSYVRTISSQEFSYIPDGTAIPYNVSFRNGQLVRATGSTGVHLIQDGTKRGFPSAESFLSYSYQWTSVTNIPSVELGLIPPGLDMPYNVHYRDGQLVTMDGNSIYLIVDGQKRNIPSESVFLSYSWKWSYVRTISSQEFSYIPDGTAIPYNTTR